MRILLEIGHPAHVHFFSWAIRQLESQGFEISIVTRNKEITDDLLDRYGFRYDCLSVPATSGLGLPAELLVRWAKIAHILQRNSYRLAASISGISTSLPSRLLSVRNITFTDTEDAVLSNRIAVAFTDAVYTPAFFLQDLGRKHHRYQGLHELTYLQHFDFAEAEQIRRRLGLPDRYVILRLIAHDALHDQDIHGLSENDLQHLIDRVTPFGKVFITSQAPLPERFAALGLTIPIESMHAVLAGAQFFIGESPTMAVESSLLGVPAFLISQRVGRLGNMIGLERDFQLLRNFPSWAKAQEGIPLPEELGTLQREWKARAENYRASMPDMRAFVLETLVAEVRHGGSL